MMLVTDVLVDGPLDDNVGYLHGRKEAPKVPRRVIHLHTGLDENISTPARRAALGEHTTFPVAGHDLCMVYDYSGWTYLS
jgi:hypothetical protein